jgi:hypothetical protein
MSFADAPRACSLTWAMAHNWFTEKGRLGSTPDCEYPRCSSAVLLGCVSVTTSVTQHLIGRVPFVRLVRSWLPAPARSELLA